jgi:hypothetical protein
MYACVYVCMYVTHCLHVRVGFVRVKFIGHT